MRQKIFLAIEGYKLPSEIQKKTNLPFSCISRTLKQLRERGLVQVEDLDEGRYRLYSPTKRGQIIIAVIISDESNSY